MSVTLKVLGILPDDLIALFDHEAYKVVDRDLYKEIATVILAPAEAWPSAELVAEGWLNQHYPPNSWRKSDNPPFREVAYIFSGGPSNMYMATAANPIVVARIKKVGETNP